MKTCVPFLGRPAPKDLFQNTIILFVVSAKICVSVNFNFSWGDCKSQEKLKTMLMQILEGRQRILWLIQTRIVIGLENNRDSEMIIPISLKTISSAGLKGTNEISSLDGCWSIAIFQFFFLTCLIKHV